VASKVVHHVVLRVAGCCGDGRKDVLLLRVRRLGRTRPGKESEVAALFLLPFEGLEQRPEVTLPEAERAVPLDQLEEYGGTVTQRLGEDLQRNTVMIASRTASSAHSTTLSFSS
jgi:hypothetical protein